MGIEYEDINNEVSDNMVDIYRELNRFAHDKFGNISKRISFDRSSNFLLRIIRSSILIIQEEVIQCCCLNEYESCSIQEKEIIYKDLISTLIFIFKL